MFASLSNPHDFSYALEKVRNAIASSERRDADFANQTALGILGRKYAQFRQELSDAGELGNYEYDLDTYDHCITVLQQYFGGNASGLTVRDARIYSRYLHTQHERFVRLAGEIAGARG